MNPQEENKIAPPPVPCGRCYKPKGEGEECCNCGRPTTYREEMPDLVMEYLKTRQDVYEDVPKCENPETGAITYTKRQKVSMPTLEGLSSFLGTTKTAMLSWEKQFPKFHCALEEVRRAQHDRLMDKGLSGEYNPTIAKLVLSSNHGYAEKTKTEHSGDLTISVEKKEAIEKALDDL